MKTPKPEPKTCNEAADRITERFSGHYTPEAKEMREVAFTLKAFGDTPIPLLILNRYNWAGI